MVVALGTLLLWGALALRWLPRQEDPHLTWRLANVITRFPGAPSGRVESMITDVLERAVEQVDEVEHIYSVSRPGLSLLQIELHDQVTVAQPVWQKVRRKLVETKLGLPPDVIGPELDDEIMGTFSVLIAISSPNPDYRQLKDLAEQLEDRLRYLPSTASSTLFGTQRETIDVELDPAQLAAYQMSFATVAAALRRRNTRQPAGRLQLSDREVLIEASGELVDEHDVGRMVLSVTRDGRTTHLGDVARIRRTTVSPADPLVHLNGVPAVLLGVRARPTVRMDQYGDEVSGIVARFRATLPEPLRCEVVHNLARSTRARAAQLSRTFLASLTLVFVSTALLMGWRGASVITMAIPLTGAIVLVLFYLLAMPLNQMSVMAIIMAMGLVVDNAIVVTEQIHRSVVGGTSLRSAVLSEPEKLFTPLLVSTLTTITAFLPIYLLPGGTGEFVRAIPIGVGVALLTSLVVALTAVPWMCTWLLCRTREPAAERVRLPGLGARLMARLAASYRVWLQLTVARPRTAVLVLGVTMAATSLLGLGIRRDFFSPVQRDQFMVDVYAPQGSGITHTNELVHQVEDLLADQPDVVGSCSFVGRNAPLIFYNLTSQETYATHFAQLIVRCSDWRMTAGVAEQVQAKLNDRIAGAECVVHILEHGAPFVAPFEVRIGGPSIEPLQELGRRVQRVLHATPGVRNIRTNFGEQALKLVAEVNEPVARAVHIDQDQVARELRYRIDGLVATHIQDNDERIDVRVRLPATARDTIGHVMAVDFKAASGVGFLPFSSVAQLQPAWETSSIYRRDGQRTLSVLAYPQFGLTAAQVAKQFLPKLDPIRRDLPANYTLQVGGENEQRHEAESNLLAKAIYAICLIVLLLVAEFRSFRISGLILAIIPLSLAGTMLGLWLTGWPLNFMAIMGMMMLMGVVVNDAVILIDGFERRFQAGELLNALVIEGTLERTRHVVITTVTTIAGFLPLALSSSLLWPPLAIAIIGGLGLATLLTLGVIPAAYVLIRRGVVVP